MSSESVVQHYLSLHKNVISISDDGLIELKLVLPSHMKKPLADKVMLTTATNLILSSYRNQLLHIFIQVGILSLVVNASPSVTMARGENMFTLFYLYLELFECNIKGMFLYSAVSSPLDRSKHFTPWQTCSFRHQVEFSGKRSVTLHAARILFVRIYTAVYTHVLICTAQ